MVERFHELAPEEQEAILDFGSLCHELLACDLTRRQVQRVAKVIRRAIRLGASLTFEEFHNSFEKALGRSAEPSGVE